MPNEGLVPVSVRLPAELYRKVKIECVESDQTLREIVQVALEDLLDRRHEDRRDRARGGF